LVKDLPWWQSTVSLIKYFSLWERVLASHRNYPASGFAARVRWFVGTLALTPTLSFWTRRWYWTRPHQLQQQQQQQPQRPNRPRIQAPDPGRDMGWLTRRWHGTTQSFPTFPPRPCSLRLLLLLRTTLLSQMIPWGMPQSPPLSSHRPKRLDLTRRNHSDHR
jgi:hypothetical protein